MADTFAIAGAGTTAVATGLGLTSVGTMAIAGAGAVAVATGLDFASVISIDIAGAGSTATAGPIDTSGGTSTFAIAPAFRTAKAQGLRFR